jgi:hypothetical protein
MRSLSLLGAFALLLIFAETASAQYYDVPDGSYLNSCRNARLAGIIFNDERVLVAECRNESGRYVSSQLDYRNCYGDIFNRNGRLECYRSNQGPADYGQTNVPYGSYLNSCRNTYVRGRVLYADCRNRSGRYVRTQIAYRYCRGDISNNNGQLNCRTRGDGDWYADRGAITLFDGRNYTGRGMTITRSYSNLAGVFNDRATSVRVYDGVWLACRDKNYRGGCFTIDRNWRSLPSGVNNNISSIRRIR